VIDEDIPPAEQQIWSILTCPLMHKQGLYNRHIDSYWNIDQTWWMQEMFDKEAGPDHVRDFVMFGHERVGVQQ
jgi:hypothetical protein